MKKKYNIYLKYICPLYFNQCSYRIEILSLVFRLKVILVIPYNILLNVLKITNIHVFFNVFIYFKKI